MNNRDHIIQSHFAVGYSNKEISAQLLLRHGISISERHLKRTLNRLGLYRRKHQTDILEVADFIEKQVRHSGQLHGYRWMHLKCIQHGFIVSRKNVAALLHILDPEGVRIRQKNKLRRREYFVKGSNFLWHVDSYDNLKPFGIAINGCIDGFSRKIVWLKAYHTNSDPRVIAGYYINTVSRPTAIRADLGTENSHVRQMQHFLRRNGQDAFAGPRSFMHGASTSNQRIEAWWCILRRQCIQFWLNLFGQIKHDGYFSGDPLDKNLMRFCFLRLIQNEIDNVVLVWNNHQIRQNRYRSESGRPSVIFWLPEVYDARSYLCPANPADVQACREECEFMEPYPCDEDLFELCLAIMEAGE